MKKQLKLAAMSLVLSSSLLMAGVPALADETAPVPAPVPAVVYDLNSNLHVTVEGIYNEKTSDGVRLGAVIRVNNTSGDTLRIPDHELRVTTSDGVVYTLRPSSGNANGVQPDSEVELTYYKLVDRQSDVTLTNLSLIDVNYDVYPKQETLLISAPIGSAVWNGSHSGFADAALLKKWGETFTIPTLESPLQYTPVDVSKSYTNQGTSYLVKLLVENPSTQTETVPALELDGKTSANVYAGKQVETEAVSLEPGEKKYIHFTIDADQNEELESVNVLSSESFTQADASDQVKATSFGIGKLNFEVPKQTALAGGYEYGSSIVFDKWNDFINPNLDVSMVEMHVTDNLEDGNKTAFAKFKLNNKGDSPIPVPAFGTEITSAGGFQYNGVRQSGAAESIAPGTSTVVSYGFILPATETGDTFKMKVQSVLSGQDANSAATYKSTIAAYQLKIQEDKGYKDLPFYPFTVTMKDWTLTPSTMATTTKAWIYTYTLDFDLDMVRDPQVVLDNNFSKMKIELVDSQGRLIGSKYFNFTGVNRLISGKQKLTFDNITSDFLDYDIKARIYESITTPTGEMNRFITEIQ